MSTYESAADKADETIEQRAQWEAFEFSVPEVGTVRVENHSHADPSEHTYDVDVRHGSAVVCECPADEYHDGPCKHRIAVENQPALLGAATDETARDVRARTDGGDVLTDYVDADGPDVVDDDGAEFHPNAGEDDPCECDTVDGIACSYCYVAGRKDFEEA